MAKNSSSRLRRNITKNNKNTAIFSFVGLFVFLIAGFILFPYIIEGIGNLSQLINKNDRTTKSPTKNDEIITPPSLDVPDATSSARVIIKGISNKKGIVEIYVNERLLDEIEADENDEFETDPLRLRDGKNKITSKLKTIDGESEMSGEYSISFLGKEPSLEISFPQDGARLVKADKRIEIQGKTDQNNNVTINAAKVIVNNEGSFSHLIELNEGDNQITIIATNEAGKTTEKKMTVNYSRE